MTNEEVKQNIAINSYSYLLADVDEELNSKCPDGS